MVVVVDVVVVVGGVVVDGLVVMTLTLLCVCVWVTHGDGGVAVFSLVVRVITSVDDDGGVMIYDVY